MSTFVQWRISEAYKYTLALNSFPIFNPLTDGEKEPSPASIIFSGYGTGRPVTITLRFWELATKYTREDRQGEKTVAAAGVWRKRNTELRIYGVSERTQRGRVKHRHILAVCESSGLRAAVRRRWLLLSIRFISSAGHSGAASEETTLLHSKNYKVNGNDHDPVGCKIFIDRPNRCMCILLVAWQITKSRYGHTEDTSSPCVLQ